MRNKYIPAAILGLKSPITYNPAYLNHGMIQQLINLVSEEGLSPDRARLYLDQMSPACRDSLIVCLLGLQNAAIDESLVTNPGGPFTATTGYTEQGAEVTNHAISQDGTSLIGTMTSGSAGDIGVSTPITTVIGVEYEIRMMNLVIGTDGALIASNAAALGTPLESLTLEEADSPFDSSTLRFVATATTTYIGLLFATSIADGIQWQFDSLNVYPVVE